MSDNRLIALDELRVEVTLEKAHALLDVVKTRQELAVVRLSKPTSSSPLRPGGERSRG